jgi:hypothetical protein
MANQPNRQSKRGASQRGSRKPQQAPGRLKLQVGKSWPDGITRIETIPASESAIKAGVIVAIVVLCSVLILGLTIHAMVIGNQQRLDSILKIAWEVLIASIIWATATHHWNQLKAVAQKAMHVLKE